MLNIAVVTRVYDIRITVGRVECRYPHGQTRCHLLFHSRPLQEEKNPHLQHGARKRRHNNHSNHPKPRLAQTPGPDTRSGILIPTGRPTSRSTTRRRTRILGRLARSRGRVVRIAKDIGRPHAAIHEARLQLGNRLLDRQAVEAAVAVEVLDGRVGAALGEDVARVGGEVAALAGDGAGRVVCRDHGEVGRVAGGEAAGGGICGRRGEGAWGERGEERHFLRGWLGARVRRDC
jgi:hypothetical protein